MNKLRRIVALLSVIAIVGFVIAAFILGVMGSKYAIGMFVLAILIPVILWVLMWFSNLLSGKSEVISKDEKGALEKGNGAGKPTP